MSMTITDIRSVPQTVDPRDTTLEHVSMGAGGITIGTRRFIIKLDADEAVRVIKAITGYQLELTKSVLL